jgi:ubiquitin carboxyl-terminal hydrolase L3
MTSADDQHDGTANAAGSGSGSGGGDIPTDDKDKKFAWPPLESNPEVFSDYLHSIGLSPSYSFGEIFGFDEDLLAFVPQPVLGVIVCHERLIPKSQYRPQDVGSTDNYNSVSYYMHQSKTLDNACGIVACLHAIFNSPMVNTDIDPNSILGRFRQTTESYTPMERCTSLEQNEEFRTVHATHASRGQSQAITSDQSLVKCHYVAYVLDKSGKYLVELDGTKAGPVVVEVVDPSCVGEKDDGGGVDLLRASIREIQGKLERKEISESLSMMTLNLTQE